MDRVKSTPRSLKKKRCKNCDKVFQPTREWQEFCEDSCRKEFWRHGGVSIRRLLPSVHEHLIRPLEMRIRELEKKIEKLSPAAKGWEAR